MRFVGRDPEFYELELALRLQHVVVVHGPGGMGKTELAKAFARWWRDSGGVDQPGWVLFHSFEPGLVSFGLDGVVAAIGLKLFGPEFIGKTSGEEQRKAVVLQALRQQRMLLVWDNFESVYCMPDPNGATAPLDELQRQTVVSFLTELAQHSRSGVIITSRTREEWLRDVRRLELGGLRPLGAAELADDLLAPYPRARARRDERAYGELLEWFGGHPLSMRLMLPHLEQLSPAGLLESLRGESEELPPGFEANAAEGRLESLGASVKYSFDHLEPPVRERVGVLALFEETVDEDVLAIFSKVEGVPARFAGLSKEAWTGALTALAMVGLLAPVGGGMYTLHPALPAYLVAYWRLLAGDGYTAEREAGQLALLQAYGRFGVWLQQQIRGEFAETAVACLERQRRTMGRLVKVGLKEKRFGQTQMLLQPLEEYWHMRGLTQEAHGWFDSCRDATEGTDGSPPDLDSAAGALWLFTVSGDAGRNLDSGNLAAAEETNHLIRRALEKSSAGSPDPRLVAPYHQLGMIAQDRGNLAQAEQWYRKSLEIDEALGKRPGMGITYHQLGMVAQDRGDLAQAEQLYRKSLEIEEALGSRPGRAKSYLQLGIVAQLGGYLDRAGDWYRKSLEIKEALRDRPSMSKDYHQLGRVAEDRGDLVQAEQWYRKSLEIHEAVGNRQGMAATCHHLGIVAQDRGDLAQAEQLYRRSLDVEEALGNRPGMAMSYGQLGLLAERQHDDRRALDWVVRCVALFEEFPHPATGPGPHHLARFTAKLGMTALESSWQQQIGAKLPENVRSAVEQMMREKS